MLSGGGDKGAFEVGVLKGLIENLPDEETDYNVISGKYELFCFNFVC